MKGCGKILCSDIMAGQTCCGDIIFNELQLCENCKKKIQQIEKNIKNEK